MSTASELFVGFERRTVPGEGADIAVCTAGSGPPLLCLHGYPQTHTMWHRVAPQLAEHFTVVLADLRGYGQSSTPPDTADHFAYSKRVMAADMASLMRTLGHECFAVVGHDRGARVGYRLALDHPDKISRYAALDVITTLDIWETINRKRMLRLYHWGFLAQRAPFAETWIGRDPAGWVTGRMTRGAAELPEWLDPRTLAHDQACFSDPAHLAATCADYRAGATIDVEHDQSDRDAGRKIACPMAVFWGSRGNLVDGPDPIATWQPWCARDVTGCEIDAGHFIAQENPTGLMSALLPFLKSA